MSDMTEMIFILDRSGSMHGLENETIGGFNAMIEKQKKEAGEALVTTVLFDNVSELLHDRVSLQKIGSMTDRQYFVRGSTALLDAIGGTVQHIAHIHRYARPEDRPAKTIVVITTDGMENSSRLYTYEKVKQLVQHEQEKYGWEFMFLGANIDAIAEAGRFGIHADHAVRYENDSEGVALNYCAVSDAVASVRCGAPLSGSWKKSIEADYAGRGKKSGRK